MLSHSVLVALLASLVVVAAAATAVAVLDRRLLDCFCLVFVTPVGLLLRVGGLVD